VLKSHSLIEMKCDIDVRTNASDHLESNVLKARQVLSSWPIRRAHEEGQ